MTDSDLHDVLEPLVGNSLQIKTIKELVNTIAPSDSNVLITGESGTGKEVIAKLIHQKSPRNNQQFIGINCAAIPENLIESELFGYKAGAFTGANNDQKGLFQAAHNGTLFLDEIGDVPLSIQPKLLRAIQEGEIKRLGDHENTQVNVRILAATHRNLKSLVDQGLFREDLYYRLNVIQVNVPALRERKDDIPVLVHHFIKTESQKMGYKPVTVSVDILDVFKNYSWPGNIRELENIIERAYVLGRETLQIQDLPQKMTEESGSLRGPDVLVRPDLGYNEAKKRALQHFNRSYIMSVLENAGGNISRAAELAGMDRSNFKKIINKFLPDRKKGE